MIHALVIPLVTRHFQTTFQVGNLDRPVRLSRPTLLIEAMRPSSCATDTFNFVLVCL
jgi:hypothetical protein